MLRNIAAWVFAVSTSLVLLAFPAVAIAATQLVTVQNSTFAPAALQVNAGDTVIWTNRDSSAHTTTANSANLFHLMLNTGGSGSYTFAVAGVFAYYCALHPNMTGTVTVLAAAPASNPVPTAAPTAAPIAAPTAAPTLAAPSALPSPRPSTTTIPTASLVALQIGAITPPPAAPSTVRVAPPVAQPAPTAADGANALVLGGTALIILVAAAGLWRLRSR